MCKDEWNQYILNTPYNDPVHCRVWFAQFHWSLFFFKRTSSDFVRCCCFFTFYRISLSGRRNLKKSSPAKTLAQPQQSIVSFGSHGNRKETAKRHRGCFEKRHGWWVDIDNESTTGFKLLRSLRSWFAHVEIDVFFLHLFRIWFDLFRVLGFGPADVSPSLGWFVPVMIQIFTVFCKKSR